MQESRENGVLDKSFWMTQFKYKTSNPVFPAGMVPNDVAGFDSVFPARSKQDKTKKNSKCKSLHQGLTNLKQIPTLFEKHCYKLVIALQ